MQRLGGVLIAVLAVFVAIGVVYTLNHHDTVAGAGPTPRPSPKPSGTTPSAPRAAPLVAFLGDDWVAGNGASSTAKRATTLLSAQLRLRERNFGTDRAGYVAGHEFATRVDEVAAAKPDVVVVIGGRNDIVRKAKGTAAAATKLFAELRAALPKARLIAVAPMWGDSDHPPALTRLAAAVRAAVQRAGGTYLDVPDPIHGHPDLMSDAADPDDDGYRAVAAAIAVQLKPLV